MIEPRTETVINEKSDVSIIKSTLPENSEKPKVVEFKEFYENKSLVVSKEDLPTEKKSENQEEPERKEGYVSF